MHAQDHFPSVRLAVGGFGDLLLLLCLTFLPKSSSVFALVTAATALLVIVILAPVFWFGPTRDRWLAALVSVFPLLIFGFIVLALLADFFM